MVADETHQTELARESRWFAVSQAIALLAGFALQIVVARSLGTADYGRFVVAHSMGMALVALLMSVVPSAIRQTVSVNPGKQSLARCLIWRVQWPLALMTCATLALASRAVASLFGDSDLASVFRWLALDLAIKAGLLEPSWHLLNGLGRHRLQAALIGLHGIVRLVFVVLAVRQYETLQSAMVGLIAATLTSSLLTTICLRRKRPVDHSAMSAGELHQLLRPWLKFALFSDVLIHVLAFLSLWVLKAADDGTRAGAYAACQMLVQPLLPLGLVLSRAAFAPFARAVAESRQEEARAILARCSSWAMLLVGLGFAVTHVCGSFLLRQIYGSQFAEQGEQLGMMFLGMSGVALTTFFMEMLAAGYWLSIRLSLMAVVTSTSLLLTVWLVSVAGPNGAATALLLTGILGVCVSARVLARLVGPFVMWRPVVGVVVASLSATGIGDRLISSEGLLSELIKLLSVGGVYLLALSILSFLSRDRRQRIVESQT